ncbi:DMT family transporter [Paenactinomyces guangxiensis]|uniref:EamA family transporter n=1 Tax=Paenactinomyces guangxiensis TaxID=1490290 RepID=A0A7W2A9E0_9BACL|nr:EamA family transporter [Paenactinomyces guangxiensis]MBA4495077.1 EamA family transporter [Paenactinomyces guangxiensis]MBH8592239.1 EamA family transporter [Paenactinomyces guangxiensis]
MRFSVAVSFIAMCFIWGSTYLFIKIGLQVWPPFLLAALRNLVACFAIGLLMLTIRRTLPRSWVEWRNLILFAIFNGSAFALIFWGERYLPSGQTAVLVATVPLFSLLLARWWTREKVTAVQYAAVVIGFIGVVLTSLQREGNGFSGNDEMRLLALLAMIAAAFCYALSYSFSKRYIRGDTYANTTIHLGVSGLYLLGLSLAMDPPVSIGSAMSWSGLGTLMYLALIGSALAYWLTFFLIERLHSVTYSFIMLVNPVVAVILGMIFLDESITLTTLLGIIAVIFGAWLVNRPNPSSDQSLSNQDQPQRKRSNKQ